MEVEGRLDELRMVESEAARRVDILTYQINEIDSARLRPGEEEELREERNRLANAEGIASLAQEAVQLLDEGTPDFQAATDLLGQVVSALHNLTRLDPTQSVLAEQAQQAEEMLAELASNLRSYVDEIEFNPRRLDQVEERLNLFYTLKKKYGADLQAVLAYADDARRQLDAIVHAGEKIAELEAEVAKLLECLAKEAKALSDSRHAAAERLESTLSDELEALSMPGARLKVDFQTHSRSATSTRPGLLLEDGRQVAFDANGFERVEFLVAVNPGEGLKPLVKTASGGETSRLMLAIKNVLAQADTIPTLIFDEIDQGIGGRVGTMVGRKLWNLARQHQVLCVTHLPQLAAFGDQHLRVRKEIVAGRTITQVDAVHGEARELEIAQMMGEVSQVTRLSAQELLQSVAHSVPSPTIRDG
jgi:DNA repair protein RecN (Recombination protein N)